MAYSPKPSASRKDTLVGQFRDAAQAQAASTPAAVVPKPSLGRIVTILLLLLAPLALAAFVSHGLLGEKSGPASADVSDRMTSAERSSEPTASPPVQTASALPLSPVASPDLDASASRLGSEAADGRTGLDANEASETTASSPPTAPPAVGEPPRTGLL